MTEYSDILRGLYEMQTQALNALQSIDLIGKKEVYKTISELAPIKIANHMIDNNNKFKVTCEGKNNQRDTCEITDYWICNNEFKIGWKGKNRLGHDCEIVYKFPDSRLLVVRNKEHTYVRNKDGKVNNDFSSGYNLIPNNKFVYISAYKSGDITLHFTKEEANKYAQDDRTCCICVSLIEERFDD